MSMRSHLFCSSALFFIVQLFTIMAQGQNSILEIEKRNRILNESDSYDVVHKIENWKANQTALLICDMWNKHWCPTATERVGELAPVMNQVVKIARKKGLFIIHAPSDVTDFYEGHPARERALNTAKSVNLPAEIQSWCSWLDEDEQKVYPIDQSDGGCECEDCESYTAWTRQVKDIEILDEDAISDSGEEIWNLLEANGIQNVMIMGVHTNMCVLGRPFGLRNMARYGKNVVLIRDLTDTMYNPKSWPYVDHFTGTDLILEHIEKYICSTITSQALTGSPPFRFKDDMRVKTN